METKCPYCDSDEIDQTQKIDLTTISPEECTHDFECLDCGCLFTITFAAIADTVIEPGEPNRRNMGRRNTPRNPSNPTNAKEA